MEEGLGKVQGKLSFVFCLKSESLQMFPLEILISLG